MQMDERFYHTLHLPSQKANSFNTYVVLGTDRSVLITFAVDQSAPGFSRKWADLRFLSLGVVTGTLIYKVLATLCLSNHLEELQTHDRLRLKTYLRYHSKLALTRARVHALHKPVVTSIKTKRSACERLFYRKASCQWLSQKVLSHPGGTPADIATAICTI